MQDTDTAKQTIQNRTEQKRSKSGRKTFSAFNNIWKFIVA